MKKQNGKGRPTQFDQEEAMAELVLLFWEKGYENTTQQDMMARTGLSSSSLLNSFGNKPEIFQGVIRVYAENQREALKPLNEGEKGIDDLLTFLDSVEAHVSGKMNRPTGCLIVKTMTGPTNDGLGISDQVDRYQTNLRTALGNMFERARKLGEIPSSTIEDNIELLAASLIGILTVGGSPGMNATAETMVQALKGSVESWRSLANR